MGVLKFEMDFKDAQGMTICKSRLTGLPLKEETIICKSIEWFNDPEPCMIHRSAVMKRIFLELSEYLEALLKQNIRTIQWEQFPDHFKGMLDIEKNIHHITL